MADQRRQPRGGNRGRRPTPEDKLREARSRLEHASSDADKQRRDADAAKDRADAAETLCASLQGRAKRTAKREAKQVAELARLASMRAMSAEGRMRGAVTSVEWAIAEHAVWLSNQARRSEWRERLALERAGERAAERDEDRILRTVDVARDLPWIDFKRYTAYVALRQHTPDVTDIESEQHTPDGDSAPP